MIGESVKPTSPLQSTGGAQDPHLFFSGHFALPPLPAVVQKLLATLHSGEGTAQQVADLLATDPGLVAQILKIVNSAYFGLPREIRDVKHAVAYLGLAEIERVALTVAVMENMAPEDTQAFERFWFHSFHTSLCAKLVARKYFNKLEIDELHVSALLHDVGKLIYLKFFPDHARQIADLCRSESVTWADAEAQLGLPGHTLLGATLAERWELPEAVKKACKCHELKHVRIFAEGGGTDFLKTVGAANLLSNLATAELNDEDKAAFKETALGVLGCDDDEFLLLMAEIYELDSDVRQFLSQL